MPQTHPHNRSTDQIFEGITWGGIAKVVGTILAVVSLVGMIVGAVTAMVVTKPELKEVRDTVNAHKIVNDDRYRILKERVDSISGTTQLIPKMASLQCLIMERDRSSTLARAARLPCDSLTR